MALPPNMEAKENPQTRVSISGCWAHAPHSETSGSIQKTRAKAWLIAEELRRILWLRSRSRSTCRCIGIFPSGRLCVGCRFHDVIVYIIYGWYSCCWSRLLWRCFLLRFGLPAEGKATALFGGHR